MTTSQQRYERARRLMPWGTQTNAKRPDALFDLMQRSILPLLGKVSPWDLDETERYADLSFLAGDTGYDYSRVAAFALAYSIGHESESKSEHLWFAPHGGHVLGAIPVAAVPNGLIVESYPESKWRVIPPIDPIEPEKSLVSEPNPIKNGRIKMTMKPGIGYVLNEEVSKDYEVNPQPPNTKTVKARPEKQYGDLLINQASLADSWR